MQTLRSQGLASVVLVHEMSHDRDLLVSLRNREIDMVKERDRLEALYTDASLRRERFERLLAEKTAVLDSVQEAIAVISDLGVFDE